MMGSKHPLLVAIFLFLLGLILGGASPLLLKSGKNTLRIESLSSQYSDIDFSSCGEKPADDVQGCVNGSLYAAAVTRRSAAPCEQIDNQALKMSCSDKVAFLSGSGASADAFCEGISDDPLCKDLATIFLASSNGSKELCFQVLSSSLKDVCLGLVSEAQPSSIPSEQEIAELAKPKVRYGLNCPSSETLCLQAQPGFKEALIGHSEESCQKLGVYSITCLNELGLYLAYLQKDVSECTRRQSQEICDFQLAVANALDDGGASCDRLQDAGMREACLLEVESAQGEGRFDYLGIGQ